MEDTALRTLWKAQGEKLEKALKFNLFLMESLQKQKAESKLNSLARFKSRAVIAGILWVIILGILFYGNQLQNIYFTISVGIIMLFNIGAVVMYINHIVLIRQIDYSQSITATQKKLSALQASTFNMRFLFLQAPFYTTWFWSIEMIGELDIKFWLISVPITLLFTILAIWLFKNLTPQNMNKKWVKAFIKSNTEHSSIIKAQDFLTEIEQFKKD